MQNVVIGNNTFTADDIIRVHVIGASGVLNGDTLDVSGLNGEHENKEIILRSLDRLALHLQQ